MVALAEPATWGVEHSAGASFAPNPAYFDPAQIVRLALEGGCNAVASTFGVLGAVARRSAHRIPFIVKLNHKVNNGGYRALQMPASSYGKTDDRICTTLTSEPPIDLVRYQVANCYMGRVSLINSGGASSGDSDVAEAVRAAVVNKRGGGAGLISGRKAFQRPFDDGVRLLHAIQDVYRCAEVTIA